MDSDPQYIIRCLPSAARFLLTRAVQGIKPHGVSWVLGKPVAFVEKKFTPECDPNPGARLEVLHHLHAQQFKPSDGSMNDWRCCVVTVESHVFRAMLKAAYIKQP